MKKQIWLTIGGVTGILTITALGVFIPAARDQISGNFLKIENSKSLIEKQYSTVSFKDALAGTKSINNGNYILYFGSEAILPNLNFLYKNNIVVPQDKQSFEWVKFEKFWDNVPEELSGDYWTAANYAMNGLHVDQQIVQPEFVAYVHSISTGKIILNSFLENLQSILNECFEKCDKLDTLKEEEVTELNSKYDFVKTQTNQKASGIPLPQNLGVLKEQKRILTQEQKLLPDGTYYVISQMDLVSFDFSPFAKYTNWNSESLYYNDTNEAKEFRNLWTYIQTKFPTAVDISKSPGLIIGFRDGNLVGNFTNSVADPKPEDQQPQNPDQQTPQNPDQQQPSPNPDQQTPQNPDQQQPQPQPPTQQDQQPPKTYEANLTSSANSNNNVDVNITEPKNNPFYNWIKTQFALKKDEGNNQDQNNQNNQNNENNNGQNQQQNPDQQNGQGQQNNQNQQQDSGQKKSLKTFSTIKTLMIRKER